MPLTQKTTEARIIIGNHFACLILHSSNQKDMSGLLFSRIRRWYDRQQKLNVLKKLHILFAELMTSNLLRCKFRQLEGWTLINRRNPKIAVNANVLSIIKRALNDINKHRIFFCWRSLCFLSCRRSNIVVVDVRDFFIYSKVNGCHCSW